MSIDGSVAVTYNFNDRRTVGFGTGSILSVNASNGCQASFSNGAGALQVGEIYGAEGTFSGTTQTFNMSTGLTDLYGSAIALLRFKAILIFNPSPTNTIVVGGGSDAVSTWLNATGTITLPPGAFTMSATPDATGWAVTASTAMNILLTGTSGQAWWLGFAGSAT